MSGPGGPKTDSILAWLSNGEYVFTAEAVKRIGIDALNPWNDGRDILSGLRGFKMGGVVDNVTRSLAIPRFAGGGLATAAAAPAAIGSTTPLHFHLGDGRELVVDAVGLSAHDMQTLQSVSLRGARVSAGRAPRRGT